MALPLTLSCNNSKKIIGYRENYIKCDTYVDDDLCSTATAEYNADGYQTKLINNVYGNELTTTVNKYDKKNHLIEYTSTVEKPVSETNTDYKLVSIKTYKAVYDGNFCSTVSEKETDAEGNITFTSDAAYSKTKNDEGYQLVEHSIAKTFKKNESFKMVMIEDATNDTTTCYDKKDRLITKKSNRVVNNYVDTEAYTNIYYSQEEYEYKNKNDDSYIKKSFEKMTDPVGEVSGLSSVYSVIYSEDDTKLETIDYKYNDYEFKELYRGNKKIYRMDPDALTTYSESYSLKFNESTNNEEWVKTSYGFLQRAGKWKKMVLSYSESYSAGGISSMGLLINGYDKYGRTLISKTIGASMTTNGKTGKIMTTKSEYGEPIPIYKK